MVLGFGYDSDGVGVLIWRVGFNGRRSRWSVFGLETGPLRFWQCPITPGFQKFDRGAVRRSVVIRFCRY